VKDEISRPNCCRLLTNVETLDLAEHVLDDLGNYSAIFNIYIYIYIYIYSNYRYDFPLYSPTVKHGRSQDLLLVGLGVSVANANAA